MPTKLTPMQWCCLYDAETGLLIAASADPASVWTHEKDGAVCHPARVVRLLERLGWLQRVAQARYARTLETTTALWLPVVQPAAPLRPCAKVRDARARRATVPTDRASAAWPS